MSANENVGNSLKQIETVINCFALKLHEFYNWILEATSWKAKAYKVSYEMFVSIACYCYYNI